MSENQKDTGKVWDRLFDHKGFLTGEISFVLKKFEQIRDDIEVAHLFSCIENVIDIKGPKIDYLRELEKQNFSTVRREIDESLNLCCNFSSLENDLKNRDRLEEERSKRKIIWEDFMDRIKSRYLQTDSQFEDRERKLNTFYEELEKKHTIDNGYQHRSNI